MSPYLDSLPEDVPGHPLLAPDGDLLLAALQLEPQQQQVANILDLAASAPEGGGVEPNAAWRRALALVLSRAVCVGGSALLAPGFDLLNHAGGCLPLAPQPAVYLGNDANAEWGSGSDGSLWVRSAAPIPAGEAFLINYHAGGLLETTNCLALYGFVPPGRYPGESAFVFSDVPEAIRWCFERARATGEEALSAGTPRPPSRRRARTGMHPLTSLFARSQAGVSG